jgi:hypothetical protein
MEMQAVPSSGAERWSQAGKRIAAGAFRRPAAAVARGIATGVVIAAWPARAAEPMPPVLLTAAEAAVRVRTLSGRILRARTAVEALHDWCEERGIGGGAIRALRRAEPRPAPPSDVVVKALGLGRDEQLECRQVCMVRGGTVLMEADNWFIPDRLLPPVRALLKATDLPFGAAIAPLEPSRRTTFLRFPQPALRAAARDFLLHGEDADLAASMALAASEVVLEVEAIVLDCQRRPLAVVAERYRASLLAGS